MSADHPDGDPSSELKNICPLILFFLATMTSEFFKGNVVTIKCECVATTTWQLLN